MAKVIIEYNGDYELSEVVQENKIRGGVRTKVIKDLGDTHHHFLKLPNDVIVSITEYNDKNEALRKIQHVHINVGKGMTANELVYQMGKLFNE